eukprot:GHVO01046612.1.p1 GENE.GHVO01046612.1~~GHVO01046612.1.p1  ORF type:complete len:130 (-),score=10.87 GHVO01046612.1:203-592(-)
MDTPVLYPPILKWSPAGRYISIGVNHRNPFIKIWDTKAAQYSLVVSGQACIIDIAWADNETVAWIEKWPNSNSVCFSMWSESNGVKLLKHETVEKSADCEFQVLANPEDILFICRNEHSDVLQTWSKAL